MGRMQILACQYDIAWEDKPENFRRIDHLLRHVAICPGSLIVLPEMFSTGFSFNLKAVAEEPDRAAEKVAHEGAHKARAEAEKARVRIAEGA